MIWRWCESVAYLGFHKGGGHRANFCWPLVLTQGEANYVFKFFLWWKTQNFGKGGMAHLPPPNTPLVWIYGRSIILYDQWRFQDFIEGALWTYYTSNNKAPVGSVRIGKNKPGVGYEQSAGRFLELETTLGNWGSSLLGLNSPSIRTLDGYPLPLMWGFDVICHVCSTTRCDGTPNLIRQNGFICDACIWYQSCPRVTFLNPTRPGETLTRPDLIRPAIADKKSDPTRPAARLLPI